MPGTCTTRQCHHSRMLESGSVSSLDSPTYIFYINKRYCFSALCPLMFLHEEWGAGGPQPGGLLSGLASVWPPLHLSCGVRLCISLCEGCKVRSTLPRHVCAKAQQGCNYLRLVQHFTRSKNTCLLIEGEYRGQLHAKGSLSSHMPGEAHVSAPADDPERKIQKCSSLPLYLCVCVCKSVSVAPSNVPSLSGNMLHISSVGEVVSLHERSELI